MESKQQQKQQQAQSIEESEELEIEYNLNEPDLKPKKTLTDLFNRKQIGIDHLLQGSDSDDTDDNKQNGQPMLLDPNMGNLERIERSNSALIDHSQMNEVNPI